MKVKKHGEGVQINLSGNDVAGAIDAYDVGSGPDSFAIVKLCNGDIQSVTIDGVELASTEGNIKEERK